MFKIRDPKIKIKAALEHHDTELCQAMVNVILFLSLPLVPMIVIRPLVNSAEYCLEGLRTLVRPIGFCSDVITFTEGGKTVLSNQF